MTNGNKAIAFCCQNSAWKAIDAACCKGVKLPTEVKLVPIPCAERISLDIIEKCLEDGVRAIFVFGCSNGKCNNINGIERARIRTAEVRNFLSKKGYSNIILETQNSDDSDYDNIISIINSYFSN